jgi:hypothetical protein
LQFHSHSRAGLDPGQNDENGEMSNKRLQGYRSLLRELLRDERKTAIRLGNEGRISDEVLRKIEHQLDLSETRLELSWRARCTQRNRLPGGGGAKCVRAIF